MRTKLLSTLLVLAAVGVVGLGATGAIAADTDADLVIEQPTYVDDEVEVESTANGTIYHVEGPEQRLEPQAFDNGDVQGHGINEGSGSLEFDEERDQWIFETEQAGTVELFWSVTETRDGGNVTETVEYTALLQVDNVDWVHRTADEDEAIQQQADNWNEISHQVRQVAGVEDDDRVMAILGTALSYWSFFESPFDEYIGQIIATVLTLVMTPGGLTVFGLFVAIPTIALFSLLRYRARTEKQFSEVDDIEREKARLSNEQAKKILSQCDLNEVMPDDLAAANRRLFGRDSWQTFRSILLLQSPVQIKGTILQLMGQVGYTAEIARDATGNIVDVAIVKDVVGSDPAGDAAADAAADGGTVEHKDLTALSNKDPDDLALIEQVDGDDLDLDIFDKPALLSPRDVDLPIDNRDVDDAELLEATDVRIPGDFETEEQMARCLGRLMEFVETHPEYTDQEGYVQDGADLLSYLAEMNTVMAHQADFPPAHVYRRLMVWIANETEAEAKLEEEIDSLDELGIGGV